MKTMQKFSLSLATAGSLLGSTAFAGNLAAPVVESVATPIYDVPVAASDWTGFHGGLSLGYDDVDGTGAADGDDTT